MRLLRSWAAPAALGSTIFTLSACSASGSTLAPIAGALTQSQHAAPARVTLLGAHPDAKCPSAYVGCFTFSIYAGLALAWCYGPPSNPCADTDTVTWGGGVCKKINAQCYPPNPFRKSISASWGGPYPCSLPVCGTLQGTYEVDELTAGAKPPKVTTKYAFKQDIHNSVPTDRYIGLAVST